MKRLYIILFLFINLFAGEVQELSWPKGDSFLTFLDKNSISQKLYYDLDKEDKELASEIVAGIKYQVLKDENSVLQQALIPISEEIQIHIFKDKDAYKFEIIPIIFQETIQTIAIPITKSPYQDILDTTGNPKLANEFLRAYTKSVDFRKIRAGNYIAIKYKQRTRLGKYYGTPQILAAMVQVRKKKYFIFKNEKDGRFYNEKGKSLTSFFFKIPVRYSRISSKFTLKRWHPVLKRYRAHLGVDLAAPRGRRIYASADGRIVFRGRKGGYGNVIEIKHKYGFKTLYAHQSKFKSGLRVGSRVKQGQLIGYVGSTGLSSGPHLHLGLYKNGRAMNPLKVITVTKSALRGKEKKAFIRYSKSISKELLDTIKSNPEILYIKAYQTKSLLEA